MVKKRQHEELLNQLRQRLGQDWQRASATVIYRSDGRYLVQCISCQSSNYSRDYVPATFVQVVARPSEDFRYDFGGRLKRQRTGDCWISADAIPPVDEVLRLATEQAAVPFAEPLSVEMLARYLDQCNRTSFEFSQWWSAGITYGLMSRADDARESFERTMALIEKLRVRLDGKALARAQWIPDAIASLTKLTNLVETPEEFGAYCENIAKASAAILKLRGFQ